MTITNPTSGAFITKAWGDSVADALNSIIPGGVIPGVVARENIGQTITSGSNNNVQWTGAKDFDTHGFHDTSTKPSRFTIPAGLGGLYMVSFNVYCAPATEVVAAWVIKNGGATRYALGQSKNDTTNGVTVQGAIPMKLVPGDYIEVQAFQNSGSNKNINVGDALGFFAMYRVGPA